MTKSASFNPHLNCMRFVSRKAANFISLSNSLSSSQRKNQNAWGSVQSGHSGLFDSALSVHSLPYQANSFVSCSSFLFPAGPNSPVVVIPTETLKVHSRCSSKPSAEGKRALTHLTLISSISTITNLSSSLITVMVTSGIELAVRRRGLWDCMQADGEKQFLKKILK